MIFKVHPQAEERKASATVLIKLLLSNRTQDVLLAHYRELLRILLCKITEADSHKHKTRFQTHGALKCDDKRQVQHEHVFQCQKMIDALLIASPNEIDNILRDAQGCTVTKSEHARLAEFDHEYGWERYRKAGLSVTNIETGEQVV